MTPSVVIIWLLNKQLSHVNIYIYMLSLELLIFVVRCFVCLA